MKKPLNNWALTLGLMAFVYVFLAIPDVMEVFRQPNMLADTLGHRDATYIRSFLMRDIVGILRSTLSGGGMLLGLAVVIELIDRIRWNGLSSEERSSQP